MEGNVRCGHLLESMLSPKRPEIMRILESTNRDEIAGLIAEITPCFGRGVLPNLGVFLRANLPEEYHGVIPAELTLS